MDKLLPSSPAWETGLANLGMGDPSGRFLAGTLAGAALVWAIRPSISFNADGSAKDWELTTSGHNAATAVPWYALAAVPGAIFATFF